MVAVEMKMGQKQTTGVYKCNRERFVCHTHKWKLFFNLFIVSLSGNVEKLILNNICEEKK